MSFILRYLSIFCGMALACAPVAAADIIPSKIKDSIRIDGVLDENVWRQTAGNTLAYILSGVNAPKVKTTVKVAYNEFYLYLAVDAGETQMGGRRQVELPRDGGLWNNDSVEFFICPDQKSATVYQLIVDVNGAIYDALNRNQRWNFQDIESAVKTDADGWRAEIKIPLANFYRHAQDAAGRRAIKDDSWRLNAIRNRFAGGKQEVYTLAALNNVMETARYTALRPLRFDGGKFQWHIYDFSVGHVLRADHGGVSSETSIVLDNTGERLRLVNATLKVDNQAVVKKRLSLDKNQSMRIAVPISWGKPGKYVIGMALRNSQGDLYACNTVEAEVDYRPLTLKIVEPAYRGAIYPGMKRKHLQLQLTSTLALPEQGDGVISLLDAKNRVLAQKSFRGDEMTGRSMVFAIPELVPGEYRCRATVNLAGQQYSDTVNLPVYPESDALIRVNEKRNLVVNGKERFPIGAFHEYWGRGLDGEEFIDFSLIYAPIPSVADLAAAQKRLGGDGDRFLVFYPEPKPLWTHVFSPTANLSLKPLPDAAAGAIADAVRPLADNKLLMAYYLADEPCSSRHLPQYLDQVADVVRRNDPNHPTFISFNYGHGIEAYAHAFDIGAIHTFPGYSEHAVSEPLVNFASEMDKAVAAVNDRKPIWAAIPLTPYSPGGTVPRMATYAENRALVYLALVHKARGIFWNTTTDIFADIPSRIGIPALSKELKTLAPVLLSEQYVALPDRNSGDKVHALGKVYRKELYILSVNPYPYARTARITLPAPWNQGTTLKRLDENEPPAAVADGSVVLQYKPLEVKVFSGGNGIAIEPHSAILEKMKATDEHFRRSGNLAYFGHGVKVRYSSEYSNSSALFDKVLIDGYHERFHRMRKRGAGKSWMELEFPREVDFERILVSWNPLVERKDRHHFDFRVRAFAANGTAIPAGHTDGKLSGAGLIITREKHIPMQKVKRLRFDFNGDNTTAVPSEIQVYNRER